MARRSALGKGLGSLMGEATAEVGAGSGEVTLPLEKISPNPDQPRKVFDEEALEELADSVRHDGVLQPLLVRKKGKGYEIVAGERRYQAARRAGLTEVPVVIRDVSDDEVFRLALIENLQREDLNPIEAAEGYRLLIERDGLTQEQLGNVLSKSRSAVANTLRLLDLPDEVQECMVDGRLTAGHARAILAVPSEEGRIRLANKVIAENLTVRQTEQLAPLFSRDETEPAPCREPTPQSFKRAAKQLREALATNVRVKRVRNKNKIEIEFASEEELARLVSLLDSHNEGDDAQ